MLPLLIGLLAAVGPWLWGACDLWAQSLLFVAVTAGFALWLSGRILVGYLPLPSGRTLLWVAGLAFLGGLSAWASPVRAYALPAWRAQVLGLWVFLAITVASKDERAVLDKAVWASAWALLLLAFYQHYRENIPSPPSSLLNQNVFAGTILLLLPLAVQRGAWVLAAGLLLVLFWERSAGAWLGLAGALILSRRTAGTLAYRLGAAIGFACLVAIYGKLQSPDVLHRWQWWLAAARMASARPWLGFGPGSFAYVVPAYENPGRDLGTLYAHQHLLETAAENGALYLLLWTAGLLHCLRRGGPHKRFGALAILIQSFWDYPLSIPANFWLFSYFTASSISENSRGVNIRARWKIPACLLVLALAWAVAGWALRRWEADRLKSGAVERFKEKAPAAEVLSRLEGSSRLAEDPETERLSAEMELAAVSGPEEAERRVLSAVAHLERAAELNPYRASTWAALERLYGRLSRPDEARRARLRGAVFCPILRQGAALGP